MLLKSRASSDMLPFSLCNKKRLAIRHVNRPLFPTTLSIPSLWHREVAGLRTYQHPLVQQPNLRRERKCDTCSPDTEENYVISHRHKRGAVTLKYLVDYFVGDMHRTMDKLEANTTLWFLKPQGIYLMTRGLYGMPVLYWSLAKSLRISTSNPYTYSCIYQRR